MRTTTAGVKRTSAIGSYRPMIKVPQGTLGVLINRDGLWVAIQHRISKEISPLMPVHTEDEELYANQMSDQYIRTLMRRVLSF